MAELSADIKDQVFEKSKSLDFYSISCDGRKCDEVCNLRKNNTPEKQHRKIVDHGITSQKFGENAKK